MLFVTASAHAEPKNHDGFYMQLTSGVGYYSMSVDEPGIDQSISGTTIPLSLMMGTTVKPGIVIGGGLFVDTASSPTVEVNGTEVTNNDIKQYVVGIGAFGDYYLDPSKGGLHFQGFLGWGGVETSNQGNVGGSDPTGLVVSAAVGYDWWISNDWSAGVMGRVAYGAYSFNDASFPTIAPAVLGTLTWQ